MWKLGLSWEQHPFLSVNKHKQKVRRISQGRERLGDDHRIWRFSGERNQLFVKGPEITCFVL